MWTQTRPWGSGVATTALATVWPATKLMFDTSGGACPHGYTVA